jgi:hypothetical protein
MYSTSCGGAIRSDPHQEIGDQYQSSIESTVTINSVLTTPQALAKSGAVRHSEASSTYTAADTPHTQQFVK